MNKKLVMVFCIFLTICITYQLCKKDIDLSENFNSNNSANDLFKSNSVPQLILILADYQYKAAFVADHELNMAACLAEIMVNCELK